MRSSFATVFLLVVSLAVLPAAAQQGEVTIKSTEVAPGIYMLEGEGGFAGGNMGVLTGEDGTVLIDDGLPPFTDKLLAAIKELSDKPVEFLINTHVHGDHVGGNEAIGKAGAVIVAHDRLRSRLVEEGMRTRDGQVPAPKDALPVLTFADAVTVHVNGHEAYVFHLERAHTDGDSAILFRDANVLHAGDVLFNGTFPFIDLDNGGSVAGYIAAQKKMVSMVDDETKVIPGHGPLGGKKDLQASVEMLEGCLAAVRKLVDEGKSLDEIVAAEPLEPWASWASGFIPAERMIGTIHRELTGD